MADNDLTTTLRITPQMDQQAVNALGDQIAATVNQRIGQGVAGGVGSPAAAARPGSGTTSTAAQVAPPGVGPTGSAQTTSTAGPPGGPGGGGVGLGGLPAGSYGRPTDFSRYMVGGTSSTSALLTGLYQGRLPQAGIALGAGAFSESLMQTAQYKAQMIDAMRQSGTPESMLPAMGALRYAGPIGAAAGFVAQVAAQNIDQGLSLQEQYSRRYGNLAPTLALGYRTGAIRNENYPQFLQRAGQIRNGALSEEEARQAMATYSGIGFVDKSPLDYLRLGMTGVSQETIRAFRANARLGATAGQSDIEGFIGTAQSAGLAGAGIDALLGQIAAATKQMAMRGVRLDPTDTRRMLDRAVAAGLSPEIAATGIDRAAGNVLSLRDQALGPFKAMGDAMVMMRALRGAGSLEGYAQNIEDIAGSPTALAGILRPGGRGVSAAYYGTGLRNALTGLPEAAGGGRPQYLDDLYRGTVVENAYRNRQAMAQADAWRFGAIQGPREFEAQQRLSAGSDINAMQWEFINTFKASMLDFSQNLMESIRAGNTPLLTSMNQLIDLMQRRP